jgi:hypothetical protein
MSRERLDDAEDVGGALADVLVVGAGRLTRLHLDAWTFRAAKDQRTVVETHDGFSGLVRARVQPEFVLHPLDEFVVDRGNAPRFFPATA